MRHWRDELMLTVASNPVLQSLSLASDALNEARCSQWRKHFVVYVWRNAASSAEDTTPGSRRLYDALEPLCITFHVPACMHDTWAALKVVNVLHKIHETCVRYCLSFTECDNLCVG